MKPIRDCLKLYIAAAIMSIAFATHDGGPVALITLLSASIFIAVIAMIISYIADRRESSDNPEEQIPSIS